MNPRLDNAATVHDQDVVGIDDGRKSVRNDQAGVVGGRFAQGNQDGLLGMGIETGGGLVKDQYPRILEYRAGDGNALLFTTRQLQAALADDGVITLRQVRDEVCEMRQSCRLFDLLVAGPRSRIGNVVAQ